MENTPTGKDPIERPYELGITRRQFLLIGTAAAVATMVPPFALGQAPAAQAEGQVAAIETPVLSKVAFDVNGKSCELELDTRTTLLDALREHLHLTGSKKGCDHGQCGACTVLVNGQRINSCLTLAVTHQDDKITTIEGLGTPENLHSMQAAFIKCDGFQCGYCTSGQICSAVATLREIKAGVPSHATWDLVAPPQLTSAELRERMSGTSAAAVPTPTSSKRSAKWPGKWYETFYLRTGEIPPEAAAAAAREPWSQVHRRRHKPADEAPDRDARAPDRRERPRVRHDRTNFRRWTAHRCLGTQHSSRCGRTRSARLRRALSRHRCGRIWTVAQQGHHGRQRILNPKTARSQVIGAMTMGVGAALTEELAVDKRLGFFVNHDLASYEVPVHADIPHQEVIFLDEVDRISSPMKAKGVGELGLCGVVAAIANATGARVRDYPITENRRRSRS